MRRTASTTPEEEEEAADGLVVRTLPAGGMVFRIVKTKRGKDGVVYFGGPSPHNRFNDPGAEATTPFTPREYPNSLPDDGSFGVCYFGASIDAAFVETFFRRLPIRAIATEDLAIRSLAVLKLHRSVRVASLTGAGLIRAGVSAAITTGLDYTAAQTVARMLWRHPGRLDGIEYKARHDDNERSIAFFDRAGDAVPFTSIMPLIPLDPRGPIVARWLEKYNVPLLN